MDDRDDDEDDSEEEEEEEEEGDDNEFVDVLDVLDGKGGINTTSDSERTSIRAAENPSLETDDEDEEMPDALDDLNNFVSNLDVTSAKRKATEDHSEVGATDTRARKRRLVKERTEAGAENEFRARSSGILFIYLLRRHPSF
jgi:U3 small nucleolar RNA-associated protein 14